MTAPTCTITFACKSGDQGQFEGTFDDTHCLFGSCVPGFTTRIINPNHHLSPEEVHHFNQYHHRPPVPGSSAQQYTIFTYERRRKALRNKDEHEDPRTSIPAMQSSDTATDHDDALADDSVSLYTVPAFPTLTPAAEQHAGQTGQSQIFHLPRPISHSSLLDTHRSRPSHSYLTLQDLLFTPDALVSPLTAAVQSSKSIPSPLPLPPSSETAYGARTPVLKDFLQPAPIWSPPYKSSGLLLFSKPFHSPRKITTTVNTASHHYHLSTVRGATHPITYDQSRSPVQQQYRDMPMFNSPPIALHCNATHFSRHLPRPDDTTPQKLAHDTNDNLEHSTLSLLQMGDYDRQLNMSISGYEVEKRRSDISDREVDTRPRRRVRFV